MDLLAEKRSAILGAVTAALRKAVEAGRLTLEEGFDEAAIEVEVPKERHHGDFSTNAALVLASKVRRSPRDVATAIKEFIDAGAVGAERIEIAGPGFINFFLEPGWLCEVVDRVRTAGADYGRSNDGDGMFVQVEFVSANPTGPMNVVNARAAAVGDCLANLLEATGHRVWREYYVNDAGVQADRFGASVEARFRQLEGEDVAFPEDGYPGSYVIDIAKALRREKPDALELPEEERRQFFKERGTDLMVEMQREDLAAFGVEFDRWFRERDLHRDGRVAQAVEALRERGFVYEEDGAVWFASTRFGDDKDRVLVKQDGEFTYLTADVAYHWDKFQRGFQRVIDIWGPDHHGYIGRMKAAMMALGYPEDALEVLILQLVTLTRRGRQVRMSKRAGEFVTLRELLDEVGRDAARFFFLTRALDSHLEFDLELAVQQTNENPVYYVQYAHARICSIFRQAAERPGEVSQPATGEDLRVLDDPYERELMWKLAEFPEEVRLAASRREPHRMTHYLQQLAAAFHGFYNHCRVIGEEPRVEAARLALVDATRIVLARGLDLIGVSAPESM